ncbi:MAG: competence protein CoiA family protein [Phycisphaerae bacterium]|nr:competence protein CoiA family protein [Phycisphaerae bacterium]
MIFNADRLPVWRWDGASESRCPECRELLTAKRGDLVVWHWAHRPSAAGRSACPHEESEWHLRMKATYLEFAGWEIEVPIHVSGRLYRLDARSRITRNIREFVHSLSPHYRDKHLDLKRAGLPVQWIFDGNEFASRRARPCRGGGIRRLLKPRAYGICHFVKGRVHYRGQLWREWHSNIWFPCTNESAAEIVRRFELVDLARLQKTQPAAVAGRPQRHRTLEVTCTS